MKLTYLLLIVSLLQVEASVYSQKTKISLETENTTIEHVFNKIEALTDFTFLYNVKNVDIHRKVSIRVKNQRIEKVLSLIFRGTDVEFVILDKQIILKRNRKKSLKKPKKISSIIPVREMQELVTGIVTDDVGLPLIGVTVVLIGESDIIEEGAITDFDGSYSIKAKKGDTILFSHIGFLDKEINIGDQKVYNVTLEESSETLDEVELISTGYQKISKERASGSYTLLTEKRLSIKTDQNILSKLEGEVSGLFVNSDGELVIRGLSSIRSNTKPLIVVDGFPIEGGINTINPNDVKSISVLKDAAAASIWGIRATNGVVVITTKKGNRNGRLTIDFSSNLAITPKPDLYDNNFGAIDTQIAFQKAIVDNNQFYDSSQLFIPGNFDSFSVNLINPIAEIFLRLQSGEITQQEVDARLAQLRKLDVREEYSALILRPSIWTQHNLAVSGGGEHHNFRASLTYNKNEGEFINVGQDQIIANVSNAVNLTSRLEASTSVNFSYSDKDLTLNDRSFPENFTQINLVGEALRQIPFTSRIVDQNGNYIPMVHGASAESSQAGQALGYLPWTYNLKQEYDNVDNILKETQIRLQASLKYLLAEGLSISGRYQYEWAQGNQKNLYNENSFLTRNLVNLYAQDGNNNNTIEPITQFPIPIGSILDANFTNLRSHAFRTQLDYDGISENGLHQFNAIAGYEVRKVINESFSNRNYGFDNQSLINQNVDFLSTFSSPFIFAPTRIPLSTFFTDNQNRSIVFVENRFLSYYANTSYTYNNKYTLTGSTRLDDTNLFGASNKFRNIPLYSVGFKWNIIEENFFGDSLENTLQFRATYGTNGNVNTSTSPFLQTTQNISNIRFNNQFSFVSTVPNPTLRLEKTRTVNIGVDFGFFNNRFKGNIDVYKKDSEDLLTEKALNPTAGVSNSLLNVGKLTNKGVDITLNATLLKTNNFDYTTIANFSYNKNELTKVDTPVTSVAVFLSDFPTPIVQGNALNTLYSLNYAGLDRNGAPQFVNENNEITDTNTDITNVNALIKEGTTTPQYYGSWINTFNYKNFSLRALTTFEAGHVFRNTNFYDPNSDISASNYIVNVFSDFGQRWQRRGDENVTDVPAFPNESIGSSFGYRNYLLSNKFVDNASHIRLQEVILSYTLPSSLTDRLFMDILRIGLQGENLKVWNFNKWNVDPENVLIPLRPTFTLNISATF